MTDRIAKAVMGENSDSSDCLGCRLVGGGGCLGASVYVSYHASKNTHPLGRSLSFLFAGGLAFVGVTRLMGLPPFDKKTEIN